MNEDKLKALLQQDQSLRDAIRQDEAERPQMPADLNARVMQKVQPLPVKEGVKVRRLWPWLAAACVAGILVVLLMPPRETMGEKEIVAKVEKKVEKKKETKPETPTKAKPNVKPVTPAKRQKLKMRKLVAPSTAPQQLIAQETTPAEPITVEQVAQVKTIAQAKTEILTERDIPITRPENYQYTPEEIALLKKQANEAYLKWVELELEIAKHNQEQTAQY
jgi:hypothetical protein